MDLVGEFHKVEIDGRPYLLYHNVEYPLSETHSHSPTSSSDEDTNDSDVHEGFPLQPLFLCPSLRIEEVSESHESPIFVCGGSRRVYLSKFKSSPLLDDSRLGHHILPLFWCNNKEDDSDYQCDACKVQNVGTDYYFCVECDKRYHKQCVESPLDIDYPTDLKHYLRLYVSRNRSDHCIACKKKADSMLYRCYSCDICMHVHCAQATIPFLIDQPKRHEHTLTLFPRQDSLTCNVCGLVNNLHHTYVCAMCNFVSHRDCIYIPQTIRISRHQHRISFTSSLPFDEGSCGVCRREVDSDYGAYTCSVCCGYAVHTRCALRNDIWDGIELEGVPEEDEDVEPFERIADGIILHLSHGHHLRLETSTAYDENKFCQACTLPIYEGDFYVCVECNFILHETCANAPRMMRHPLHPHPLKLEIVHVEGFIYCGVCTRRSNGFVYRCPNMDCNYQLDMRCALVSEPFEYEGHRHPLFLATDPKEQPICRICKTRDGRKVLNCIECSFIICFECATLPYRARYKHDDHYLTFCRGLEASDSDWCDNCEGNIAIGGRNEGFFKCDDCRTTLHIDCLIGEDPYLKPGETIKAETQVWFNIHRNSSLSRPICKACKGRCQYQIFFQQDKDVFCSLLCIIYF